MPVIWLPRKSDKNRANIRAALFTGIVLSVRICLSSSTLRLAGVPVSAQHSSVTVYLYFHARIITLYERRVVILSIHSTAENATEHGTSRTSL